MLILDSWGQGCSRWIANRSWDCRAWSFFISVVNACRRSPSRSTLLQSVCKISGTLGVFCHCCKERWKQVADHLPQAKHSRSAGTLLECGSWEWSLAIKWRYGLWFEKEWGSTAVDIFILSMSRIIAWEPKCEIIRSVRNIKKIIIFTPVLKFLWRTPHRLCSRSFINVSAPGLDSGPAAVTG